MELALDSLKKERQRTSELNIKLDFLMKDYKTKV